MFSLNDQIRIGIGCDPEFFALDKTKNMFVSAHDLVPGTKEKPYKLVKGAVQADGVAIEFNIDPAYTKKEFIDNNQTVLEQIRKIVPSNYEFVYKPTVIFDEAYFEKLPEKPKELGCAPDFSAQTGSMRPAPAPLTSSPTLRAAGGHIHISWTKDKSLSDISHRFDCEIVVRTCACVLVPFFNLWDQDRRRRNLYGSSDSMRYKPYGVEWRSPSNAWLNHKKAQEFLFDAIQAIVKQLLSGEVHTALYNQKPTLIMPDYWEKTFKDIRHLKAWHKAVSSHIKDFPEFPEING